MRRCAGSVFAVQVQLRKYVLDHADSTASTRHEVDCTDPKCIPGMSCLADLDRELYTAVLLYWESMICLRCATFAAGKNIGCRTT